MTKKDDEKSGVTRLPVIKERYRMKNNGIRRESGIEDAVIARETQSDVGGKRRPTSGRYVG